MPQSNYKPAQLNKDVLQASRLSLTNLRVPVKAGDNWLILGRKGSGKTTFGKMLLSQLSRLYPSSRLYILDIKLRDFNDWPGIQMTDNVPMRPGKNDRIQVWQPVVVIPEKVEEWLFNIRHDSPAFILVDEVSALNYGTRNTSPEFTKITKLGRGLPVGTISHTQELVDIPRGILSQPDHIARFRLKRRYDKNLANQMMTEEEMGIKEPTDKYGFWYSYSEKDGEPIYYPDAQTFLGIGKRSRFS